MIRHKLFSLALAAFALPAMALSASASPILLSNVTVSSAIVTVGDMFDDAGILGERALFRAPAPGTTGTVSVDAIRTAATRAGIADFENPGVLGVRVARLGTVVDETMLSDMISNELSRRGTITAGMSANTWFDSLLPAVHAASGDTPVRLANFSFAPLSGKFSARFEIPGRTEPLDITGRVELMIEVPHLLHSAAAGATLTPDDIEMRTVPLRFAETNGISTVGQLVGKQLRRPAREGKMLNAGDVMEPRLIARNAEVTIFYRSGPMTLTVKGRALNDAAYGQMVSVLNLMSNKTVTGTAVDTGAVQITNTLLTASNL